MKSQVILQTARETAAEQKRRRGEIKITDVAMYCETCNEYTAHKLYCNGEWERYECACGTSKEYRIR